ncbi:MAG: hypothetical protein ACJATN_000218 [Neolewinella sp.]|jgi:hypothetical protein
MEGTRKEEHSWSNQEKDQRLLALIRLFNTVLTTGVVNC